MSHDTLQTVNGAISPDDLGKTLMHEHLMIGYPGSEVDTVNPGPNLDERVARCIDRIEEIKDLGFRSLLDPCPSDLGRDVELMAKVAQKTGFQIVCATGLYKQSEGGYPYWHMRQTFGSTVDAMAEIFIKEISEGIGDTGVRAGIKLMIDVSGLPAERPKQLDGRLLDEGVLTVLSAEGEGHAACPTSIVRSETSTSPEINFGRSKSRVSRRTAHCRVRFSTAASIGLQSASKRSITAESGQTSLIPCISFFVTALNMVPPPMVSSS